MQGGQRSGRSGDRQGLSFVMLSLMIVKKMCHGYLRSNTRVLTLRAAELTLIDTAGSTLCGC